jgi:hypothetical protein
MSRFHRIVDTAPGRGRILDLSEDELGQRRLRVVAVDRLVHLVCMAISIKGALSELREG